MTSSNQYPDRGKVGPTPAMTSIDDESFLDYVKDLRSVLMMAQIKNVTPKADAAIKKANITFEPNHDSVESIRAVIREEVPEAATWLQVRRSAQQAFWTRVADSYEPKRAAFLRMLDDYDERGPGSVTWDPEYKYPAYAYAETHLQNGGYVGDMLSGLVYDYGTKIFHGKASEDDFFHRKLAERAVPPIDGRIEKIMDIACAVGQLTCAMKERFPDAEVWGSDISAGMVRYAHYRAVELDLDVSFLQKAAEDLDELREGQFDLITTHLLFHEVPLPVTERTIKNVFRLLRPGGTFWVSDFPSLGDDPEGLHYDGMTGALDSADNSEPFAPEFTRCGFESKLKAAGFQLRYEDPADLKVYGRVCDKPV